MCNVNSCVNSRTSGEVTGLESILDFLLNAKRATYASQGDDASVPPLLTGSRQLEHRDGSYFYRDIYFGVAYFVGQETVYENEQPLWSMGYSGGVEQSIASRDEMRSIYAFLRSALRQVPKESPYRGPQEYSDGIYVYRNSYHGDFERFWGEETIFRGTDVVYSLRYGGGLLR
jgi:hypothetical protein